MSIKSIIQYFSTRHLLTNVIFVVTLIIAIISWISIGKEELPEFASDTVRVFTAYPGAPAEDVELFVTKPIEEELKGVSGIYEIKSTSSLGSSTFVITIDPDYPDKDKVLQDIKDAVLRADLPTDVRDLPTFRQFKSSEKAIIDIALIHKNTKYLDQKTRSELQKYALSFENQMIALPQISSIDKSGYLDPEIHILMDPKKLRNMEISINQIHNQIRDNHIRVPIGSLNDRGESKVTALNELDNEKAFKELVLRGSYAGPIIKLGQIADIKPSFEKSKTIKKIQGHEAIILNVKKSVSTDILTAKEAVLKFIKQFKTTNADSPIHIVLMDDESYDVTNRLSIISFNGILGFILILGVLFLFLDMKSGFWVAMGIPFSLAFTIILTLLVGYTVNNMTLAGIIIVLGIVVDDAIIIAENILQHKRAGKSIIESAVQGTREVFHPILASVITTCIAFIPLFFFEGFFGKFVRYIPLMVIFMLLGSIIESVIILPSHMIADIPLLKKVSVKNSDWFFKFQKKYENFLSKALKKRKLIFLYFALFLLGTGFLFNSFMKFSMFPREETKEIFVKVIAENEDSTRFETAKLMEPLEAIFIDDKTKSIVAVRSSVGQSRRGGQVKENEGWIRVEIVPANERDIPFAELMKNWEAQAKKIKGFKQVRFFKHWFGHGSGSAIELLVQENDDKARAAISEEIKEFLEKIPSLSNVEIEKPLMKKEYLFMIDQKKLVQWRIEPSAITTALRSFVEGSILYTINKWDEEVDVRLTVPDNEKVDLSELLDLKVENKEGQLIYLKSFVKIIESVRPVNISRTNYKRTMTVYGDMSEEPALTPLEIADKMERELFPKVYKKYPGAILKFIGEIEDSRKSKGEFMNSIILVIIMIYAVLVIMFNSLTMPLIIITAVPFGMAGAALALMIHGMNVYGFFAIVGALGMIGVVVNDSIVMIDKLENSFAGSKEKIKDNMFDWIAAISATRLRPVLMTTITTVVALLPTAYGVAGYDSMLAEMMLTMGWGLAFSTVITLILVPSLYSLFATRKLKAK